MTIVHLRATDASQRLRGKGRKPKMLSRPMGTLTSEVVVTIPPTAALAVEDSPEAFDKFLANNPLAVVLSEGNTATVSDFICIKKKYLIGKVVNGRRIAKDKIAFEIQSFWEEKANVSLAHTASFKVSYVHANGKAPTIRYLVLERNSLNG